MRMIAKWKGGYDVVYGTRAQKGQANQPSNLPQPVVLQIASWLGSHTTGHWRLPPDGADAVVDTLRAMPERDRFVRGMVSWVGFKQVALPISASAFARGEQISVKKNAPLCHHWHSFISISLQLSVATGIASAALSAKLASLMHYS